MKLAQQDLFKILLLLALGFYMWLIGFGVNLLSGGGAGIDVAKSGSLTNQIVGLALLGLSLLIILKSNLFSIKHLLLLAWPLWMLLLFFWISIQWSYSPAISLRRIVALSTMAITCLLLVKIFTAKSLLNIIANAIVLTVILGLLYTVLTGKSLAIGLSERGSGLMGIFGDKNAAARVYAYGLLFFIGLGRYKTKVDIICLCLLFLAIATSQSATAVVMAFFGCGLFILFKFFRGSDIQNNLLRFVILVALLIVGAVLVNYAYDYILTLLGRDPTLTNRSIIWSLIDPLIAEEPTLGYGYGAFWISDGATPFIERWGFIGNAHSGYKELLLHGGSVGLILLFIMLAFHIKKAISMYISPSQSDISAFLLMMVLIQTVINYIAYVIINHNSVDMFIYLICLFMTCNQVYLSKQKMST